MPLFRIGPLLIESDTAISPLFAAFSSEGPSRTAPTLSVQFSPDALSYRYEEETATCVIPVRHHDNPATINEMVKKCMVSFLLQEKIGFLFHAALLVNDAFSFLLTGVSGSGKSTLVHKLAPFFRCGNDDLSLVQPDTAGLCVFSTPFCDWRKVTATGTFPFPLSAQKVSFVALLEKEWSAPSSLSLFPDKDAVWRFFIEQQQIFFPHWSLRTTRVLSEQVAYFIQKSRFVLIRHNLNDPPEKVYELIRSAH